MRVLHRLRDRGGTQTQAPPPRVAQSAALTTVFWLLTAWTAFCGISLVALQGNVTRVLAAGLADQAGQRLLGVEALALAAVYGLAAWRSGRDGVLTWIATGTQIGIAAVAGFDAFAGRRGFGDVAFVLVVALGFGLLLLAFRLAGEPAYLVYPPERSPGPAAAPASARWPDDAPTERLAAAQPSHPQQDVQPRAPSDDEPLGL